ncbi:MAG: tyrosine-protein phosphatase, partial [Synergistaceae bacterium]|nr:tyrosine-protein phosphatase [Synergistaceae bacterium]
MKKRVGLTGFLVVFMFFAAAAAGAPRWAAPIGLEGVPNLYKVSDTVYRSGQPTRRGFRNLRGLGVKTVLNLRSWHSDSDELRGTSLREIRVRVRVWRPETGDVLRVLRVLADKDGAPYLVHCDGGADRTGMAIALYRMVIQGWDREDAIREMKNGGYGFSPLGDDIPDFLRRVDIEALSRDINPLPAPPPAEKSPAEDGPLS